ncbi:MAG TPA: phosphatidate cytidylyltransferase [Stellaceae bacterium]|nr:phosphatidate cytidylyltransferase [Stellaceae bacterium]
MARDSRTALRRRVLSALMLAPVALFAVWLGGPVLSAVTALAGALMAWEWARLCGRGRLGTRGIIAIVAIVAATAVATGGAPIAALGLILAATGLVVFLGSRSFETVIAAFGLVWIGIPCIALVWLSQDATAGRATVFWILAVVWATDIGAYGFGRTLGGPRLAPRASPNKTWSGLLGGILCASVAGTLAAVAFGAALSPMLPALSALLAIIAQSGDLAESMMKRHFGVKDSSNLIPGHGGLLDRLDGLLTVIPTVAFLSILAGGSMMTWR